jgi:ribosomal protein S18 acetylase RimI-like enzyme
MHLLTVDSADDPHLPFIQQLFNDAFPVTERREWAQLLAMLISVPEMHLQVVMDAGNAIGFTIYWDISDWRFIEYLAIDPACRGRKYGNKVMDNLILKRKVLLEIEPPVSTVAQRRVKFYEGLGLAVLPYHYCQPSYRDTKVYYEMKLMSNVPGTPLAQLNVVLAQTLQKVYGTSGLPLT